MKYIAFIKTIQEMRTEVDDKFISTQECGSDKEDPYNLLLQKNQRKVQEKIEEKQLPYLTLIWYFPAPSDYAFRGFPENYPRDLSETRPDGLKLNLDMVTGLARKVSVHRISQEIQSRKDNWPRRKENYIPSLRATLEEMITREFAFCYVAEDDDQRACYVSIELEDEAPEQVEGYARIMSGLGFTRVVVPPEMESKIDDLVNAVDRLVSGRLLSKGEISAYLE